jgi:hypothetical protein
MSDDDDPGSKHYIGGFHYVQGTCKEYYITI